MNRRIVGRIILGLALALLCARPSQGAAASEAPQENGGPRVALNTNFAGCIKPSITDYAVGPEHIDASLRIVMDTDSSEGPCVCRGGIYYFQVFPSDKALPKSRAWMFTKSFYKADLAFGVLPLKPYVMPHLEQIRFPTFKNINDQPFTWYYVAIGCP